MTRIPLVDLKKQRDEIGDEIKAALADVIDRQSFINGACVREFERAYSARHGEAYGAGCSSGTTAISLVLDALDIGTGDEVITVSHTFFATAGSITNAGATPVLVDVEPSTLNMDPAALEAAITPRTRAIMPVHLYGNPANLDRIADVTEKHGFALIEDAAQAHLAKWQGRPIGTFGAAATYSFYPAKNLGAYGDAGFVLTTDRALGTRLRQLANHGRTAKYEHEIMGYNARMDEMQAAVLSVKLKYLESWNDHRRAVAARYDAAFGPKGFKLIEPHQAAEPVYHLYVVEVDNREEVMANLAEQGIDTGIHYPVPVHLQPVYADLGWRKGQFPVTERAVDRIVSLPICGNIAFGAVDRVIEAFLKVARP